MDFTLLGDTALVVDCGDREEEASLAKARAVAEMLHEADLPGVVDAVPAFAAVTVFYDITQVDNVAELGAEILRRAKAVPRAKAPNTRRIEVPVCYGGIYGPDLDEVARQAGRSVDEVVTLHSQARYVVEAIGFVPGFPYLRGLPKALHLPRRSAPRIEVPMGSVGIGGGQTGVYPQKSPGGWHLIGRSPLRLFDLSKDEPVLLRTGDEVIWKPISEKAFLRWK